MFWINPMKIYTCTLLVFVIKKISTQAKCNSQTAKEFENNCYELISTQLKWTEAQEYCWLHGKRSLAKVGSQLVLEFLHSLKPNGIRDVWVGANDKLQQDEWVWTDGTVANLTSMWSDNEPNNHEGNEHCLESNGLGKLNDFLCSASRSFICVEAHGRCISQTAKEFENNCYELIKTPLPWSKAQEHCLRFNGKRSLAKVGSHSVLSFLNSLKPSNTQDAWLGANDMLQEGNWVWTDGTKAELTSMWNNKEPNNLNGNEHCLESNGLGKLNDSPCSEKHSFICMEVHETTKIPETTRSTTKMTPSTITTTPSTIKTTPSTTKTALSTITTTLSTITSTPSTTKTSQTAKKTSSTTITTPSTTKITSSTTKITTATTKATPSTTQMTPTTTKMTPSTITTTPPITKTSPSTTKNNPSTITTTPSTTLISNPLTSKTIPSTTKTTPSTTKTTPSTITTTPSTITSTPSTTKTSSTAKMTPSTTNTTNSTTKTTPSTTKTTPSTITTTPSTTATSTPSATEVIIDDDVPKAGRSSSYTLADLTSPQPIVLDTRESNVKFIQPALVAFTVGLSKQLDVLLHDVIVYNKVVSNVGDDYNNSTGVFRCNIAGVYFFQIHGAAGEGIELSLSLVKNKTRVISLYSSTNQELSLAANSAVLLLEAGDEVFVEASNCGSLYGEEHHVINTFSGFLLGTSNANA
ncbi:uncharacterized protein LOC131949928 [Physella acuta]|uniref:uncharacterized protein LOC131949928 n=1 Tax=Physella acuta TaxID=109671 RepID=UPI0027DCB2B5|nr:uncharacterized protein LOC131949928 [Physella acuta]